MRRYASCVKNVAYRFERLHAGSTTTLATSGKSSVVNELGRPKWHSSATKPLMERAVSKRPSVEVRMVSVPWRNSPHQPTLKV